MGWFLALLLMLALPEGVFRLRPDRPTRRGLVWPLVLVAASIPFWLGEADPAVRAIVAGVAVVYTAKTIEFSRGGAPSSVYQWRGAFWLWFVIPPEVRFSDHRELRPEIRRRGVRRLGRALVKGGLVVLLLAVASVLPHLHGHLWGSTLWAMWCLYLCISGGADLVTGWVMVGGVDVAEVFKAPPLSRSPQDFWGSRWNLYISTFAKRNVFLPFGGVRHPFRALMLVFGLSGLMHEYIIAASFRGISSYNGWMMLFFLLHGLATAMQTWVRQRRGRRAVLPYKVAMPLHFLWIWGTAPLFFKALEPVFNYERWRLW